MAKKPAAKKPATPAAPAAPSADDILSTSAAPAAKPEAKPAAETETPTADQILSKRQGDSIANIKSRLPSKDKTKPASKPAAKAKVLDDEADSEDFDDDALEDSSVAKPAATKKEAAPPVAQPGGLSKEDLVAAQEAGLTIAQAKTLGSKAALKLFIESMQSREEEPVRPSSRDDSGAPDDEEEPAPAQKVVKKPAAEAKKRSEISFDDLIESDALNETTAKILKSVAKAINERDADREAETEALKAELAETKKIAAGVEQHVQRREATEIGEQIDDCFSKLPEELQEIYGTVPTENLPAKSPILKDRDLVRRLMASIQQSRQNAGLKRLTIDELHDRAIKELHPDLVRKSIEKEVTEKLTKTSDRKRGQEVLRSSGRDPGSDKDRLARLNAKVDKILNPSG